MITDKTSRKVLARQHKIAGNALSKGIGLMFRMRHPGYALVFPFSKARRVSLTMWFVFFPIDVLFLDERMHVVEVKKEFKPWTNYTPKSPAITVVELEAGSASKVKVGDLIDIQ